jgi:hypothetical protein
VKGRISFSWWAGYQDFLPFSTVTKNQEYW